MTSAARKPQSLRTTAAAVFVITSEDIRRSGIRLMPDLLRLAPGVQVSRLDSGNWAISIRGFSSDFSNKLLVLVDGQSIYNEEYGGVFWDTEQMPVENIDRIEVIRGPGAAMWGNNAVNGVINIITKSSADTLGGMISGGGGRLGNSVRSRALRGRIGTKATYRVTGYYAGERRVASSGNGLLPAGGFNSKSMSFRVDWKPTDRDTVFVTGRANRADDSRVVFDCTSAQSDAGPKVWEGSDLSRVSLRPVGHAHSPIHPALRCGPRSTIWIVASCSLPSTLNVGELGVEHHWKPLPRHDLVWGLRYRKSRYSSGPRRPSASRNPMGPGHLRGLRHR